ncbi:MAG: hypothetical protein NW217_06475, partial [Hyphomicrobiaceae bacterium]|nr:hypothetical protein [Hyphomicrobiaceae bacterium]
RLDADCSRNCAQQGSKDAIRTCETKWEEWAAAATTLSVARKAYHQRLRSALDAQLSPTGGIVADADAAARDAKAVTSVDANQVSPAPFDAVSASLVHAAQLKASLATTTAPQALKDAAEAAYLEQLGDVHAKVTAAKMGEYGGTLQKYKSGLDDVVKKADAYKSLADTAARHFAPDKPLPKLDAELKGLASLKTKFDAAVTARVAACKAASESGAFGVLPATASPGKIRIKEAIYGDGRSCNATDYFRMQCEFAIYQVKICKKEGTGPQFELEICANQSATNHVTTKTVYMRFEQELCDVPVDWKTMCGGYNPAPTVDRGVRVQWSCGTTPQKEIIRNDKERVVLNCK